MLLFIPRKRFARPEHFYLGAIPGGRGSKRMLHSVLVFHLGSLRRSSRSCDRQRQGWHGSIFSKRGSQRHPRPGLLVARIIVALLWACPGRRAAPLRLVSGTPWNLISQLGLIVTRLPSMKPNPMRLLCWRMAEVRDHTVWQRAAVSPGSGD